MTKQEKKFIKHLMEVLKYDTSDGAPPLHNQFYERHKESIEQKKREYKENHITFSELSIDEKREKWRQYNEQRVLKQYKLWEQRQK